MSDRESVSNKMIPNDFFEIVDCPVCKSKKLKIKLSVKYGDLKQKPSLDYSYIGVNMNTVLYVTSCRDCKFVFVNPRIKRGFEHLVYNDCKKNMYKNKSKVLDVTSEDNLIIRRGSKVKYIRTLLKVLNFVELNKKLTLVDYGCGFGHTMSLASEFGIDTYGVEIDVMRLAASRQLGLNVATPNEFKENFPNVKADILMFQSCIEHVIDLQHTINFIRDICNDRAVLYLNGCHPALINIERIKGEFVKAHFIEHINYFPLKTLDGFMAKFGFTPLPEVDNRTIRSINDLIKSFMKLYLPFSIPPYFTGFFERTYRFKAND